MEEVKQKIGIIRGHVGNIDPPMPMFMYGDIRDRLQLLAAGDASLVVLENHLSSEIGEIKQLLSHLESLVDRVGGGLEVGNRLMHGSLHELDRLFYELSEHELDERSRLTLESGYHSLHTKLQECLSILMRARC